MAQECAICAKTRNIAWTRVKLRGKYNPTVRHKQKPNLQWMTLHSDALSAGKTKRVKACAKCIKTATKKK